MNKIFLNHHRIYNFIERRRHLFAFVIIVIIFIPIVIYGENYTTPSTNKGSVNGDTTLIFVNTVYSLEPSHYSYIQFSLTNGGWNLIGSITSSTSVLLYILNQSCFSNFTQGKTFKWTYEAFADSSYAINLTLMSGSYYLVFYNQNTEWGVGVEITSNFILTKN